MSQGTHPPTPPTPERRQLRLLLVEDSPDEADLLIHELERGGFDVSWERVDTAPALLAAIHGQPWDIVISDFAMPTFDGLSAFRLVREHALETPFIFVSGVLGEERAVEAMRQGARDYVLKGSLGRLAAAVARELDQAAARHQKQVAQDRLRIEERRYQSIFQSTAVALAELDFSRVRARLFALDGNERADLRAHLAAQPDVAAQLARDLQVLDVNQAMVRLLEAADRPQALGQFVRALGAMDGEPWSAIFHAVLAGRPELQLELEVHAAAGRTVPVLLSLRIPTNEPDFQNVVLSLLDVSEQRALEDRMRETQRLETLGRLAGGVAHDFNNVLAVIGSFAATLRDELVGSRDGERDLDAILEATRRGAALTAQLLAFGRRQVQQLETVDLNQVIAQLERMLRRLLGEAIELVAPAGADQQLVRADPTQLEQVLMNLAVNARDAMPAGGRLTIETGATVLREGPGGLPPGEYVLLSVSDSGTGMDDATRRRAFEPFFSTKEPGKGAGMGLAIVYGVVKQSGGHVEIRSAPGLGTRFDVYLPRVHPEPPARPGEARGPVGSETVLVVDGDPAVREAARRILQAHGYRVLEAASGEDALRTAESLSGPIHLLLTAIVLPRLSGRRLVELVKLTHPSVEVVYLPGGGEPLEPHGLLVAVRRALDARLAPPPA